MKYEILKLSLPQKNYIMKYLYIILLALLPVCSLQAQDVINKMSIGTCQCLEKGKVADKPSERLEIELGLCLLEQVNLYDKELKKEGYDTKTSDFYEKIGETVGAQMAITCPYFMDIVMKMLKDDDSDLRDKVMDKLTGENTSETTKTPKIISTTGTVQTVEYGDFVKISIKDSEGKRKEFYWINSFEGDDKVIALTSPDLLVGKTISVGYMEEDVYFYKMKSYLGINKIKSLVIK